MSADTPKEQNPPRPLFFEWAVKAGLAERLPDGRFLVYPPTIEDLIAAFKAGRAA